VALLACCHLLCRAWDVDCCRCLIADDDCPAEPVQHSAVHSHSTRGCQHACLGLPPCAAACMALLSSTQHLSSHQVVAATHHAAASPRSHAPSAPWLDSLLARALQHARQEVRQSAAGSAAPAAAAGAGAGDPLQQLMQARVQLRVQERKAAAADALAGLLAACARLRYLPEERWLAGALPLLLQHLLHLSPGQLASTACSLAALGLLQPDASSSSSSSSSSKPPGSSVPAEPPVATSSSSSGSSGSSSSGALAQELWDKSLTLLRVLLAAKLGSASSRPAMVVPEGEEEEGAGGEEWDGFEYDVDSGPGQARMLADVLAAAAESQVGAMWRVHV
jgi:hypothetical protein